MGRDKEKDKKIEKNSKNIWEECCRRLFSLRQVVAITFLISAITTLLGVISPVFNRIFYDYLLSGRHPDWFAPFMQALAVLFIVEIILSIITTTEERKIDGKLNTMSRLSYMWKILYLPMEFFSTRTTGDLISRQNSNANISSTLIYIVSPLLLNSGMMIFYFVIMIHYSWILTLVGIVNVLIDLGLSRRMTKRRVELARSRTSDSANLSSATIGGIKIIDTIKSSGAEEGFFARWAGYYASENASTQNYIQETSLMGLIPSLVSTVTSSVVLGLGIFFTLEGNFTLGAITAFQGFFSSFMSPAYSLLHTGETIEEMRVQMERLDEVMEYPQDPNIAFIPPKDGQDRTKLSGRIEIKDITFGYNKEAAPLINHFSLDIKPGSSVAFVGTSGCGKSTLSKLISGFYAPWSGQILFDGKPITEIDHALFTSSLAVVDQEILLFQDTIENNIKMWDNAIEDFAMILAAKNAQIHDDIMAHPKGYQHVISENGKDFSGGQRQRLEIARVLAQDPNIIILDEATSALDATTEYEVIKAIRDRGITSIIIAHRLSTIRDCDEIIVMDKGACIEHGTHEDLVYQGGIYKTLITND